MQYQQVFEIGLRSGRAWIFAKNLWAFLDFRYFRCNYESPRRFWWRQICLLCHGPHASRPLGWTLGRGFNSSRFQPFQPVGCIKVSFLSEEYWIINYINLNIKYLLTLTWLLVSRRCLTWSLHECMSLYVMSRLTAHIYIYCICIGRSSWSPLVQAHLISWSVWPA